MDAAGLRRLLAERIAALAPGDAARLFHGRGQCYEGWSFLNVDWFAPVIWAVIYGEPPEASCRFVAETLAELAARQPQVKCVLLQRRIRGRAAQERLYGELPQACYAGEDGARYQLNFAANQNIGFFLDARPGRQWLRRAAAHKRVLNLFAYTCSFSVAALQGGAASVVNIDMAKSALATGQRNHALNALEVARASFLPHELFRSTRRLEQLGPYDRVVIDPPSRQKGSFEADRDYGRLLSRLAPMLAPGAELLACLNAPYLGEGYLPALFAEYLPQCAYLGRLPQREDFPERDSDCCLKMQLFRRGP